MENIDFLLRGFAYSAEEGFLKALGDGVDSYKQAVEAFLPKVIEQTSKELLRCNLGDIITIMQSFSKLFEKQFFAAALQMKHVYFQCDVYLQEYLGQVKKDITGSQFAQLVSLIAHSHATGIHKFH